MTGMAAMISVKLAGALKVAGLVWHPASGDRFTLTTGAFDGEVFALSDMVVEAQEFPSGTVLGFNGTTEWALDSAQLTDALWLPREDQLRRCWARRFERSNARAMATGSPRCCPVTTARRRPGSKPKYRRRRTARPCWR
jgi:hypothetical protein